MHDVYERGLYLSALLQYPPARIIFRKPGEKVVAKISPAIDKTYERETEREKTIKEAVPVERAPEIEKEIREIPIEAPVIVKETEPIARGLDETVKRETEVKRIREETIRKTGGEIKIPEPKVIYVPMPQREPEQAKPIVRRNTKIDDAGVELLRTML